MKYTPENGFHFVYEMEMLFRVVDFLEVGFGWDKNRSQSIIAHLDRLNTSAPKAAVYYQNSEIKIAILLFDQTGTDNSPNKIINLSSWYAKETYRGIEAIRFAKKLTTELCEYTITNYTPSPAVEKVLTSLGYEYMNVEVETFGLNKTFPFIKLRTKRKYFTLKRISAKPVELIHNHNSIISKTTFKLSSIKKNGIKLITLSVYVEREESYISLLWLIKYIFFYGVVRVNIYSEMDAIPHKSPWLIKNIQTERYIPPSNSELSF
jgi:hypothetical protein